jgi:hypothetical protein
MTTTTACPRHLRQLPGFADLHGSIQHQDVHRPQGGLRLGVNLVRGGRVCQIGDGDPTANPISLDFFARRPGFGEIPRAGHHHIGPEFRQGCRNRAANPLAGSGDQGPLARQIQEVFHHLLQKATASAGEPPPRPGSD